MKESNCWEFMGCPESTRTQCPAYPDKGLDCWKTTGTKCDKGRLEMATKQEKIIHCSKCEFYIHFAHKF